MRFSRRHEGPVGLSSPGRLSRRGCFAVRVRPYQARCMFVTFPAPADPYLLGAWGGLYRATRPLKATLRRMIPSEPVRARRAPFSNPCLQCASPAATLRAGVFSLGRKRKRGGALVSTAPFVFRRTGAQQQPLSQPVQPSQQQADPAKPAARNSANRLERKIFMSSPIG